MANISLRRNQDTNVPARSQSFGGFADPLRMFENLLRWDPFAEMTPNLRTAEAFLPAFEVKETKDSYIFKADMPGVKESDLNISLTGTQMTISGKREAEREEDVNNYYAYERSYGAFTRTFTLPQAADVENVNAELKDGVLTVIVPKKPELQPRRISLSGGQQSVGQQNVGQQNAGQQNVGKQNGGQQGSNIKQ